MWTHVRPSTRSRADTRERGDSPWLGRGAPPSEPFLRYQDIQRGISAMFGRAATLAPATPTAAFLDWWVHLAGSPAKQWELAELGFDQALRWLDAVTRDPRSPWCIEPMPQDKRFDDPAWRDPPFGWLAQAFLLRQQWWQHATAGVPGVNPHHEHMVSFGARQWLDMVAPSNSMVANPVVLRRTLEERGANLARGAAHMVDDLQREAQDQPPFGAEKFRVGENIAVTPGRVVLRNRLIELIQYEPTTRTTHPEPVLIVPAWIMKYYVLDLSPHNSLIRHLVDRGFTVFAISWKNPDAGDRDLGFDDYHALGVQAALDAIGKIVPASRVHAVGYCLGGTLLAMAAAALGRSGNKRLKTLTLLAAQTDFDDPGEISMFIDESQVAHLEDRMWQRGTLDKRQMKATFQMIRSNDLVWSYRTLNYLLGERQPVSDLMAWNADGTRMPYRMHAEYLRRLFLHNALARGEMTLAGNIVNLHDIDAPLFLVATVQDHIAPWRSVFKLNALTGVEQTLVLAAGGHNVGIVNPPGSPRASYRLREWRHGERILRPEEWLADTAPVEGSWWTAWFAWLAARSTRRGPPPPLGAVRKGLAPQEPAPGTYVHLR
ncbi:PHA/PHB synthase family protein [Piscinibacter sp.]|uniref:PHA/PHB synthase family protein n=1 Tax=Piscinibacter sp. TaxID=1903157 RepID=UPI002D17861F|nr:alpha/beta fold hydrolase [Albitalea sp.]HUG21247.1 alpha/beta fold hydrolase [Albitalea sp.]